jgi:hypothetical protein
MTSAGVGVVTDGRLRRFCRWHLFDEARVTACEPAREDTAPRWRLTPVNAYKPSISTYLHRRGTDAAIFEPCVELTFPASAEQAAALAEDLEARVTRARRDYRALRLREMDLPEIDTRGVLSLSTCPHCRAAIARPGPGRCDACGFRHEPDMFLLERGVATPSSVPMVLAMLAITGGALALGSSAMAVAIAAGAVAALSLLYAVWRRWGPSRHEDQRLLVRAHGLEIFDREAPAPTLLPFADFGALRWRRLESGQHRLAAWRDPKRVVIFSPLLFMWISTPPGRPIVDVLIGGDERAAKIACTEIERRWKRNRRS